MEFLEILLHELYFKISSVLNKHRITLSFYSSCSFHRCKRDQPGAVAATATVKDLPTWGADATRELEVDATYNAKNVVTSPYKGTVSLNSMPETMVTRVCYSCMAMIIGNRHHNVIVKHTLHFLPMYTICQQEEIWLNGKSTQKGHICQHPYHPRRDCRWCCFASRG
jgi:hypothetical protein